MEGEERSPKMALTRWEPFTFEFPERWKRLFELDADDSGMIRVEEVHENGTLVVRAEIPGVDPDKDIDVSISEGVLHIGATRSERSEKTSEKSHRSEFRYGSFRRDLVLPRGVDSKAVKAGYKDGILEVRIPWPAEKPPQTEKVSISRG
jgi:HSP20 family protein